MVDIYGHEYPSGGHAKGHWELARASNRRKFGQITKLPSGRYRARYADPDGRETPSGEPLRYNEPYTFESKDDAEAWLVDERRMIAAGSWAPPSIRRADKLTVP